MCGLAGVVGSDPRQAIDYNLVLRMRDSLTHRGPDDAGVFVSGGVGLGSRRLAILDLSERGHMPMTTADGRFSIVYNGEIYNYRELRRSLVARGHQFHSNTDTEVLLALFVSEGPEMLSRLNGMFAFAVWDAHTRQLFAARDRVGVKPLFYALKGGDLYFGSEPKALFAGGIPRSFDHGTWPELLCFRFVAGERTPFAGVRRLLPGHYFTWKSGELRIQRWWNLGERARALREARLSDPVAWFRETFDDAVTLRRISDVPVGVLLSGGLDSSSVAVSLAKGADSPIASFTIGFKEANYDERALAGEVAQHAHLEAHAIEVGDENLLSQLRRAIVYNDEPLAHSSDPHLLAISAYAKPRVTVLLSGEGADETLGGYVRYRPLRYPRAGAAMRPIVRGLAERSGNRRLRKLGRLLDFASSAERVIYSACDTLPADLSDIGLEVNQPFEYRERIVVEAQRAYPDDLMRQAMYSDQHTYLSSVLDRSDRMTMAASIECRLPFLDYRLVEGLAALPTSVLVRGYRGKSLLRRSIGHRLPRRVLQHAKWGFGVPWNDYIRRIPELRRLVEGLPRNAFLQDSPIDLTRLARCLDRFWAGSDQSFPLIMQLLMTTESWSSSDPGMRELSSAMLGRATHQVDGMPA